MLDFPLKLICALLMSMSVVFIVIELRARFEKSFLIFGITNILLSVFCAIDIWIQPDTQIIYWTQIQHIIAVFFPAFLTWYILLLLRRERVNQIRFLFFIGLCFSLLFFTDLMFKPSETEIVGTHFYNFTFVPYMLFTMIAIPVFLIRNISRSNITERKVLLYHLAGIICLSVGGVFDMISVMIGRRVVPEVASFSTLGLLAFGIVVTYVFTDRLTVIIRDRETTFAKLQAAYREMEEVQSLKELGQSTAIINHEIKNYAYIISGYAQYLKEHLDLNEKNGKMVSTIIETATKMADFSKEILNFSKAKIVSDKRPLAIFPLIEQCLFTHFTDRREDVVLQNVDPALSIHGDWNKLEHVFVNLIKNAFEAEATTVSIKALRRDTVLLLVIEDNGDGCTDEQLGMIFKSFYTTKKRQGGTGLGMCIVRSIIESHGGCISAYSKNVLDNGSHGLILNISFPIYSEARKPLQEKSDMRDPIILIKEGVENLAHIIRVFQNVMVTPYIVQRVEEIDGKKLPGPNPAIYASMESIEVLKKRCAEQKNVHALVNGVRDAVFVAHEMKKETIRTFSENYVLEHLSE
ncbi:MAG: ATP-binding protein [Chitinispirillaceae bacterium]|nr:ATP-binding protein [Chitinispirillaceae bacterium]